MVQIDEEALEAAHYCIRGRTVNTPQQAHRALRSAIETYLNALPKPATPFEQAIQYRKITGMDV